MPEIQKTPEPRGKKFILIERIGKAFLEKNAIKLDFEYWRKIERQTFPSQKQRSELKSGTKESR